MGQTILIIAVLLVVVIFAKRKGINVGGYILQFLGTPNRDMTIKKQDEVIKVLSLKATKLEEEAKKIEQIKDNDKTITELKTRIMNTQKQLKEAN